LINKIEGIYGVILYLQGRWGGRDVNISLFGILKIVIKTKNDN